ncbi:MAG TPA: LptF/LptG family permease, partial [Rhodobacteraceae bacterium]|nr:LptF/LptG family permease [Paracoccaceae bacterium]
DGITFYIREITPQGELKDVFMSDSRDPGNQVIYTAKNAFLVHEDSGPKLVMFDGMAQTLTPDNNRLFTTSFSDFSYDIGALVNDVKTSDRRLVSISTPELIFSTKAVSEETGFAPAILLYIGHDRIAQPLLAIVAALIGFSTLLVGNFNRFGLIRQIMVAILLLVLIRVLDSVMTEYARRDAHYWWLLYMPVFAGFILSAFLLWLSERPGWLKRKFRRKKVAA